MITLEKVPFFTPVVSAEKPCLPVLKVFDYYLNFGDEIAVQRQNEAPIDGSRGCDREIVKSNCVATVLKIATYILSAGIFPLIALIVKAIARCAYQFHYHVPANIEDTVRVEPYVYKGDRRFPCNPVMLEESRAIEKEEVASPRSDELLSVLNRVLAEPAPEPLFAQAPKTSTKVPDVEPAPALTFNKPTHIWAEPIFNANQRTLEAERVAAIASLSAVTAPEPTLDARISALLATKTTTAALPALGMGGVEFEPTLETEMAALEATKASAFAEKRDPWPAFQQTADYMQTALSLAAGQSLIADPLEAAVKNRAAKDHFSNRTLLDLERARNDKQIYSDRQFIPLGEESIQAIQELIPEKANAYFANRDLPTLELDLRTARGYDFEAVPLCEESLQVIRRLIPQKATAIFSTRSLSDLESALKKRSAIIDAQYVELGAESLQVIQELIAEKRKQARVQEIDSDEDIEEDPAPAPVLSALKPLLLGPSVDALKKESLNTLQEAVKTRKIKLKNTWSEIALSEESIGVIKGIIAEKANAAFEYSSFLKLEKIVKAGEAFVDREMVGLSTDSLQVIRRLITQKTNDHFAGSGLLKLEKAVKAGRAFVDSETVELSAESLQVIRGLITEKANAYFMYSNFLTLEKAVKAGRAFVDSETVELSAESLLVIRRLITDNANTYFANSSFLTLEKAVKAGRAFVDSETVDLSAESLLVIRRLITENANTYFANSSLLTLEKAVKAGRAFIDSQTVELSAESLLVIRRLITENANAYFANSSLLTLEKAVKDGRAYIVSETVELSAESLQVIQQLIQQKKLQRGY